MLSVHQFVGHLDLEAQGAVLVSKDAFLSFLREQYRGTSDLEVQAKRDLEQAAREQVGGNRIDIAALPDEREAAKAVLYAVMRLADKFKAQTPENAEISSAREYTDERWKLKGAKLQKRWKAGYNGAGGWATHDDLYPRMPFVLTFTVNGRETARLCVWENKLETTLEDVRKGQGFSRRYVAAIAASAIPGGTLTWKVSHPKAESLARRMLLEAQRLAKRCPKLSAAPRLDDPPKLEPVRALMLPNVSVEPEVVEVGETLHFDASSRENGYATVFVNAEPVDRVRCWQRDRLELLPNPERDTIRGGTIRRTNRPRQAWRLQPNEERVIELERMIVVPQEERCKRTRQARKPEECDWLALPVRHGPERYYGRGTQHGELWLRGTADAEVMRLHAKRLIAQVNTISA
jgi:hypothetical protein